MLRVVGLVVVVGLVLPHLLQAQYPVVVEQTYPSYPSYYGAPRGGCNGSFAMPPVTYNYGGYTAPSYGSFAPGTMGQSYAPPSYSPPLSANVQQRGLVNVSRSAQRQPLRQRRCPQ